MLTKSSKRAAAAAFALTMSVGAAGAALQAPSAHALTTQQIQQAGQAIQFIRGKGCAVTPENGAFLISCSTKVIANLIQPELSASELKLYNRKGKSYARFKLGRNGQTQTTRISNVYVNPRGPLNLKIMPDNINSSRIELKGTNQGFQFITRFESAGTEFQVEDKYLGKWCDRCFPDVHWNSGRITANLPLTSNMQLRHDTQVAVSGEWMLRGNLDVIPDRTVNNSLSSSVSGVLQNNVRTINTLINQELRGLATRLPNNMANNIRYSFSNGNVQVRVPVR
jgi:hypothetical protein